MSAEIDKKIEILRGIEDSIAELTREYKANRWSFLTESDFTCRLYSLLLMRFAEECAIHSELRPFYAPSPGSYQVIKERDNPRWGEQKLGNDGFRIDIALIDRNDRFAEKAFEKAQKIQKVDGDLRYWRMLSYPVEAFIAAIEIKIRVSRNQRKIRKDINKLARIKDTNAGCLLYLVIMDSAWTDLEELEEMRKKAAKEGVDLRHHLSTCE